METYEDSIFEADLNILQYSYLTGIYIDCPLLWTKISYVYKYKLQNKKTGFQLEHSLEGPQPWSDP